MKAIVIEPGLMYDHELGEIELDDGIKPGDIIEISGYSSMYFVVGISKDRRIPEVHVIPQYLWGFLNEDAQQLIEKWKTVKATKNIN